MMSLIVSVLAEVEVQAPLIDVLSHFTEIDLVKTWFPQVTECMVLKQVTDYRGLYFVQAAMPWPVWPRELVFKATGMLDKKNKGILIVAHSAQNDSDFFDYSVPETSEGYVRIDLKRCFHYFQQIGPNKTKYISITNADPKLTYMPNWFMNFITTKVSYQMLVQIQNRSSLVSENEYGIRIKERDHYYQRIRDLIYTLKQDDLDENQIQEEEKKEENKDSDTDEENFQDAQ
ncbi:UNKNOWN [Stylonychia lemnae]|uniref:START domain-containing protein n=1 Tax=Stylonychia lemnae TaxID=5949 RepID=A0A078BDN7_STYLE|nr:UNKNOWN [Stylonychia lemnae]|eukprot:CDW91698.1 UNKNOWN [Stylonychia lemnae]